VLSTRWRRLPWLLPELDIDAEYFMFHPQSKPNEEANGTRDAMRTVTAATRSLLAKPRREYTVTRLRLTLYLINSLWYDIGQLVWDAIECGSLKDLELAIIDDTYRPKYSPADKLRRSQDMGRFFRACPRVLHCITRLTLCSLSFDELDMHHILFDCCKQLKHLSLIFCDAGAGPWKIDAPNSKLRVLDLNTCYFDRIDLISLPKLETLCWDFCVSRHAPLSFGFVPSLEELDLAHFLYPDQDLLKLSELLHGAEGIHTLTLDFLRMTVSTRSVLFSLVMLSKLSKLYHGHASI
jgi:hypothetical protein